MHRDTANVIARPDEGLEFAEVGAESIVGKESTTGGSITEEFLDITHITLEFVPLHAKKTNASSVVDTAYSVLSKDRYGVAEPVGWLTGTGQTLAADFRERGALPPDLVAVRAALFLAAARFVGLAFPGMGSKGR